MWVPPRSAARAAAAAVRAHAGRRAGPRPPGSPRPSGCAPRSPRCAATRSAPAVRHSPLVRAVPIECCFALAPTGNSLIVTHKRSTLTSCPAALNAYGPCCKEVGRTLGFIAEASSSVWYLGPPADASFLMPTCLFGHDHRCFESVETNDTRMQHHRQRALKVRDRQRTNNLGSRPAAG